MLMDPSQVFSISATLAELDRLSSQLPAGDIRTRGEISYLRGFVLYKADRPKESLPPSMDALQIDAAHPFLSVEARARLIYDIATQAEDLGQWDVAIDSYRKVIPLFDVDPNHSEDQRLGTRERLAFCLHEAGKYVEAMALNKEVLAGGERLFGPEDEKLLVVVTNLAQNAHALGDKATARTFLERRLDIATKHGKQGHIDESLFQLGVLSFEMGQREEAETFMRRRLAAAEKSGNSKRIADARDDLETLYKKMRR